MEKLHPLKKYIFQLHIFLKIFNVGQQIVNFIFMMIVQILKMEEDVLHIIMNVPNALILKINKVV